jgi:hypothetical protein
MKSELRHLLQKLKSEHPDFQNLVISSNGVTMAVRQHGTIRFESLDELEAYAWPSMGSPASAPASPSVPQVPSVPSLPFVSLDPPATSGFIQTQTGI